MSTVSLNTQPSYEPFLVVPDQLAGPDAPPAAAAVPTHSLFGGEADSMPFYDQGSTNACGTTSLAMILGYLVGAEIDRTNIDREMRRSDSFSSPADLVAYARSQGLSAEMYNHGDVEGLMELVDQGIPCQVLVGNGGSMDVRNLHYMAVTGMRQEGGESYVVLHDPNRGEGERAMLLEDFVQQWEAPIGGLDKFFIAYAPGSIQLPPSDTRGAEGVLAVGDGAAAIVNHSARIWEHGSVGSVVRGVAGLLGAVPEAVVGAAAMGVQVGTQWAADQLREVPLVGNAAAEAASFLGDLSAAVADLFREIGSFFERVGKSLEEFFQGDQKSLTDSLSTESKQTLERLTKRLVESGHSEPGAFRAVIEAAHGDTEHIRSR